MEALTKENVNLRGTLRDLERKIVDYDTRSEMTQMYGGGNRNLA